MRGRTTQNKAKPRVVSILFNVGLRVPQAGDKEAVWTS